MTYTYNRPTSAGRHAFMAGLLAIALGACSPTPRTDEAKLAAIEEMAAGVDDRYPNVEQLTVDQVGKLIEMDRVVLVDVREAHEREVSAIPGSITAADFEADPAAYDDRIVVAYCTIGARSSEFAKKHTEQGHPVANLRGSILAWTHSGGPLVSESGPTTRVHVYGQRWNLAASEYEAVW